MMSRYSWRRISLVVAYFVVLTTSIGCKARSDYTLEDAVRAGDLDRVSTFLRTEAGAEEVLPSGERLLGLALSQDRFDIAATLINHGANSNSRIMGIDILFVVAASGPLCTEEVIRALITHGRTPTETDMDGNPVLHYALWTGANRCAQVLIDEGADVTATPSGGTMVHSAAVGATSHLMRQVLSRVSDIDQVNRTGLTALMLASQREKTDIEADAIVDLLLQSGADACVRSKNGRMATDFAHQVGAITRADRLATACPNNKSHATSPSE